MSRAAKATLTTSIIATVSIVWGVHYVQKMERENMYKGVQRDEVRQAERKQRDDARDAEQRQRAVDLERNRERERNLRSIQPIEEKDTPSTHRI
ncbi:uncharacterized protein MJAP1_003960 [Malassezia japonica]|uniref:Cytochrome c oxidase assembly protein n=1 Tax=Malassezia japonica TaxID=223818 RepID=A0AAF0F6S6_9BASI|nr:uncharacterized protein MJAP1_003960 [Malassezia japonica]WFD40969.1 hypothetical protein MJAP1_003960 [Malassezia japonica]